jgi:hypothetical protein
MDPEDPSFAAAEQRPVVFVHTNARQRLGALVSARSFRRNARDPGAFDVRLIEAEHCAPLRAAEGRSFLRAGHRRIWRMDDLQSFTPLRFAVPDAMGHRGVALVVDPDVFAVGDAGELFARDRQGKAIWCRAWPGHNGAPDYLASSVMLLDGIDAPIEVKRRFALGGCPWGYGGGGRRSRMRRSA